MSETTPRRKILILEKEQTIRNALSTLLANINCDHSEVGSGRDALAEISRESFDAVLLDLRSSELPPGEVIAGIHQICPSLTGHVMVITGEAADAEILELVERHLLLRIPQDRIWQDMRLYLRVLLQNAPARHHV